jgi:hypothetical protein
MSSVAIDNPKPSELDVYFCGFVSTYCTSVNDKYKE